MIVLDSIFCPACRAPLRHPTDNEARVIAALYEAGAKRGYTLLTEEPGPFTLSQMALVAETGLSHHAVKELCARLVTYGYIEARKTTGSRFYRYRLSVETRQADTFLEEIVAWNRATKRG